MDPELTSYEAEYHSYRIIGSYNNTQPGGHYYSFFIYKEDVDQFSVIVCIGDIMLLRDKRSEEQQIEELRQTGIDQVKGRVDLQQFSTGVEYRIHIGEPKIESQLSVQEIKKKILLALTNVRNLNPRHYKQDGISVNGICSLLGIEADDYFRAINDLNDNGLIEEGKDEDDAIANGKVFISHKGMESLRKTRPDSDIDRIDQLIEFNQTLIAGDSNVRQVNLLFTRTAEAVEELRHIELEDKLLRIKVKEAYGKEVHEFLNTNLQILNDAKTYVANIRTAGADGLRSQHVADEWDNLHDGDLRIFCLVKIDVVESSVIKRENTQRDADDTFTSLHRLVEESVLGANGEVWKWEGDGGLCAFLSNDPTELAEAGTRTALRIIEALPDFNESTKTVSQDLQVRIAVHSGQIRYKTDIGLIQSSTIDFVAHLEGAKSKTLPDSISISGEIYRELSGELKEIFKDNGIFEEKNVYTTRKDGLEQAESSDDPVRDTHSTLSSNHSVDDLQDQPDQSLFRYWNLYLHLFSLKLFFSEVTDNEAESTIDRGIGYIKAVGNVLLTMSTQEIWRSENVPLADDLERLGRQAVDVGEMRFEQVGVSIVEELSPQIAEMNSLIQQIKESLPEIAEIHEATAPDSLTNAKQHLRELKINCQIYERVQGDAKEVVSSFERIGTNLYQYGSFFRGSGSQYLVGHGLTQLGRKLRAIWPTEEMFQEQEARELARECGLAGGQLLSQLDALDDWEGTAEPVDITLLDKETAYGFFPDEGELRFHLFFRATNNSSNTIEIRNAVVFGEDHDDELEQTRELYHYDTYNKVREFVLKPNEHLRLGLQGKIPAQMEAKPPYDLHLNLLDPEDVPVGHRRLQLHRRK